MAGGDAQSADMTDPNDPRVLVPPEPLAGNLTSCPAGFEEAPGAGQHADFEAAGQMRSFHILEPDTDVFPGPRPILIQFNGTGGNGLGAIEGYNLQKLVDDRGWIVLAPDSAGNGTVWPVWDAMREPGDEARENADLVLFDTLLDCMAGHIEVDAKRIYIAGMSAGGIMSNYMLQHRSSLLAGGIVASGILSLTKKVPAETLGQMAVLVTWGGDNDEYSGSASGSMAEVAVPKVNFVEQASLASIHYEDNPDIHQVYCRGKDLGHTWLTDINEWMFDYLEAHPKGLPDGDHWTFADVPEDRSAACSEDAYVYVSDVVVECTGGTPETCRDYCQYLGDCVVENGTVAPVLGPQITALGFTGENSTECGGCVSFCEMDAEAGPIETEILTCFSQDFNSSFCAAGVDGAYPLIDAVNACCAGKKTESAICGRLCDTLLQNDVASSFFAAGCS
jgi:poly(3-hydroxybutyrate) depolymerase